MEGQILIFMCVLVGGQVSGLEIDHWGRHFVLSFIRIENMDTVRNILAITARETTDVRVVFHQTGTEEHFSIISGKSNIIAYNYRVTPNTYTIVSTNMAISVESSKPVSVYGYVYNPQKSEGFLVLPVASLGTSYMTVTYEDAQNSDHNWNTQIVIIAVEDDTELTIELPDDNYCLVGTDNWEEKRSLSFKMDSYDVVNIMCKKDTTGSLINSTKPIAVLSGAKRIRLEAASYYHPIVEMLPPITEFGTEYIFVAPIGHTYRCMLRVVALHPDTTFDFKGEHTLTNSGTFVDIFIDQNEPICFNSNKPVIVAMFMTGRNVLTYDNYTGNAFMSIIPPVTKFSKHYMVAPGFNYFDPNFVNRVDIVHKNNTIFIDYVPSYLCDDYVMTKFIYNGLIKIRSNTPILALVYGYAFKDGYGFPAGMKLTDFSGSDECISSPCQNGGWCLEVGYSFRCYCPDSKYTGVLCQTELIEPDQNNLNGTVVDTDTTSHFSTSIRADQSSTVETSTSPATHQTTFTTAVMTMITTATADAPSTEKTIITTDTPSSEQSTITTATPSTEQTTVTTDAPSTEQTTITTDTPSTEQTTVTTDTLSTEQPTITTDTTSTEQTTIATDTPSTEQTTITTDTLSTEQTTITTDTTSTEQRSTTSTEIQTYLVTTVVMPSAQQPHITSQEPQAIQVTTDVSTTGRIRKPKPYCSKMSCMCSCPCKKSFNSSRALESITEIREKLKVDKTSLSKTFRKKNSSKNVKIVEEEIGQSVFIIVMFPFACLVLSDLCKVVYWLLARRNQRTLRESLTR